MRGLCRSNIQLQNTMEIKYIHFSVYALVFTLYGSVVTGIGPIVLFYSKDTGQDETYYSFIFFARALGYLAGGQIIKLLTDRFRYHQIYVGLIVICAASLIASSINLQFANLFASMFIAAACSCMINILSNLCIFEIFSGNDQDYWLQMINLFFGIGGLIGPIIVIYFKVMAMRAIGVMFFLTIIPFYFLKSPEKRASSISNPEQEAKSKSLKLTKRAEFGICCLFFFYIASEVGYASWIPTYAFKSGVALEDEASSLASIFWIVNTVARLLLLYWKGPIVYRLRILLRFLVACALMTVFLQMMGMYLIVSYLGIISSGICLSAMYALFFTLAIDYGYGLSPSNTANFAMSASLGEGLLVMPIGYAMGVFGVDALIVIILMIAMAMMLIFEYLTVHLDEDSKAKNKEMMVPLVEMSGDKIYNF